MAPDNFQAGWHAGQLVLSRLPGPQIGVCAMPTPFASNEGLQYGACSQGVLVQMPSHCSLQGAISMRWILTACPARLRWPGDKQSGRASLRHTRQPMAASCLRLWR